MNKYNNKIEKEDILKILKGDTPDKANQEEYLCYKFADYYHRIIQRTYNDYISGINLSIVLCYLLNILLYTVPPYKIKGSGHERVAGIKFLGFDSENPEEAKEVDMPVDSVSKAEMDELWDQIATINK